MNNNNNNIQIFNHEVFGKIRLTKDEKGNPWFCLLDVCSALALLPKKVAQRLGDEVLSKYPISDSLGRQQLAIFVNEDGLYDTILDSRKPEAKAFRKWVTSEVLPQIRRTGGYIPTHNNKGEQLSELEIMAIALQITQRTIEQKNAIIEAQQPAVVFTEAVEASVGSIGMSELAKLISQNGVPTGQKRLFQWMRDNGYLGRQGEFHNLPKQRFVDQGLFEVHESTFSDRKGEFHTARTTKITGKGQTYFINLFINSNSIINGLLF